MAYRTNRSNGGIFKPEARESHTMNHNQANETRRKTEKSIAKTNNDQPATGHKVGDIARFVTMDGKQIGKPGGLFRKDNKMRIVSITTGPSRTTVSGIMENTDDTRIKVGDKVELVYWNDDNKLNPDLNALRLSDIHVNGKRID